MLETIVKWSLQRPQLIAWACALFLAWGVWFVHDLRFDLLPSLAPAETSIQTEAPGLAPEQVEALITRPIESAIIGATGVADVRSESVQGLSVVHVRFAEGADPYRARQFILESLSALSGTLPATSQPPRIAPLTSKDAEVLKIGFTSDRLDALALRDLVQWTVRPRVLAAAGVARASVYGGQTRRIEVRARPADLSDSDLGFLDILKAVRRATSVVGAGFIDTPAQRVQIEPHGQALTANDVAAGQIQTPGTAPVRIGDVSDVVETPAPAFGDALINGRPAVILTVARQFGANTLETTHAVEAEIAVLRPALAAQGVKVATDLDRPASFTTSAIRGVVIDLVIGAVLIALILVLLMREPRAVLISLISIPLSVLAALITLKALDGTLDSMTLGGLTVSLGLVIDDAVNGVDNVVARLRDAEHNRSSDMDIVLAASLEVRRPVTYAVVAVIISIAPLLALRGLQGALLSPFAVAVIAASLASVVVATVVTPALCLLFHRHDGPPQEPRLLTWMKEQHRRSLERICPRPAPVMIVAAAAVVLAGVALATDRSELLPSVHDGHIVARASTPPATSLDAMRGYGAHLGEALRALPGVASVAEQIGRDPTDESSAGPESAVFDIALAPGLSGARQAALARQVREELAHHPGMAASVSTRFDAIQRDVRVASPVQIRLFDQDLDALSASADQIGAALKTLPGARDVQVESEARGPVVRVDLNFARLALYGLSSADVLETVGAAFAGERVGRIYDAGRTVDLAVSAQAQLRQDPEGVGELLLRSSSGISVPLKTVANVYLTDGRQRIDHDGGLRRMVITASPAAPGSFLDQARKVLGSAVHLPPGAFVEFGGADQSAKAAGQALLINYLLAALVVAGLLAIAYDGLTAGIIMASTLLTFVGAVAAVAFMGAILSVGAIVGFVSLFGISVRNSILLFDRLDDAVMAADGRPTLEAVLVASRQRFTPVLITSLLIALGLAPLAIDAGQAGREILGPMAIVIIGGLVTGTLASLFILPVGLLAAWRRIDPVDAHAGHDHGHGGEHHHPT